jgi:hypothetical protein
MHGQALELERHDAEARWAVDHHERALRRQRGDDRGLVPVGRGQPGDIADFGNADGREPALERLVMIDDVMRTHVTAPGDRLGPRRRRDDGEAGQAPRQLRQDRADAARAVDDEHRILAGHPIERDREPIEQQLPRRQRRERQHGGGAGIDARRPRPDETLVGGVQLGVDAGTVDRAGVEHGIARLEQARIAAPLLDLADRVIAENPRLTFRRPSACPQLDAPV